MSNKRGRPKLPRPEGISEIDFLRERHNAAQRKYYQKMLHRSGWKEDYESREYFINEGLGEVIRNLDREVELETGDSIL